MKPPVIDLRSDTLTQPTREMREAILNARLGDDVFREDPTVNTLERLAADTAGKEEALLVTSGTQGNLVSLLSQTNRGDEIILEENAHIYKFEVGAFSAIGGLIPRLIPGERGVLRPEDIERVLRPPNIHVPPARTVCVENTHNLAGGTVTPPDRMAAICRVAHAHGLTVHLDGARVFNAAVSLGVDVKALTESADTVQFCLSKGLCAPIGSIVASSGEVIERARRWRKMLGGGMRQAGVIAAAGIVALEKMVGRLLEDHRNARTLAEHIRDQPGLEIDMGSVQTNIVMFRVAVPGVSANDLVSELKRSHILTIAMDASYIRAVTHHGIEKEDIDRVCEALDEACRTLTVSSSHP